MAEAHPAHEPSDIHLRALGAGLAVIAVGIALAIGVPWIVIGATGLAPSAPNNARLPALREPRQPSAPAVELGELRREKAARLESAGFDAAAGDGHIPIERAMETLVAERAAQARAR